MKKQRLLCIFFSAALLLCCSAALVSAFTLPDTGQTKCYDTSGNEISCVGSGQDGAYNINTMSFMDNGNGTITDNVSGLMWQQGENNGTYNWYEASGTYDTKYNPSSYNTCGSLTLGGYSDWRLPTKKELITLVDYSIPAPGPTINRNYFPNTHANYHWSSTTNAFSMDYAWFVYFNNGDVYFIYKSYYYFVRCVRASAPTVGGGQPSPSLTDNGNGTVTDNGTGLMWQQGEAGFKTWVNALTYCENLSLGGQSDWRLPNIKEMESVTNDAKNDPAIDTSYFPNTYAYDYWSSTTYAGYTDGAWGVSGSYGNVSYCNKSFNSYARCVRGGQSGALGNLAVLTVNRAGSWNGTVTSEPSGINCGTACSASFAAGTSVTLTAAPDSGYTFTGWNGGGCSGTGTCTVTVNSDLAVTATFTVIPNNCAATLSGSFLLHEPHFTINGSFLSLDLQYAQDAQFPSTDIMFKLTNAGGLTNPSDYSSCQASALSVIGTNYVLHIPIVILGGTSYWLDLTYVLTSDGLLWFKLTGIGVNT